MAADREVRRIEQDPELGRYSRQVVFAPIGPEGQRRLLKSRVTLIGCGGLGSSSANMLARAGVGFLRIVDRDFIELNNLQRQVLFTEDDIAANLPKAEAARRKLQRINSTIRVEAVVADVNHRNVEQLCEGADLVVDGTDNFETRFLINDVAVKTNRPWVYGACVGATGLSMPIVPHDTPCLRCVFEQGPPPEMMVTCATVGVLSPAVNVVAAHQVIVAMKILMGQLQLLDRRLLSVDIWKGRIAYVNVQKAYDQGSCPCCRGGNFEYLAGKFGSGEVTPCGRDAVQIRPPERTEVDFAVIAEKIAAVAEAEPQFNAFALRAHVGVYGLTVFADGRAIISGVRTPEEARTVYAKYIGA